MSSLNPFGIEEQTFPESSWRPPTSEKPARLALRRPTAANGTRRPTQRRDQRTSSDQRTAQTRPSISGASRGRSSVFRLPLMVASQILSHDIPRKPSCKLAALIRVDRDDLAGKPTPWWRSRRDLDDDRD